MIGTERQCHFHIHHRITGQHTGVGGFKHPFFNCADKLTGDHAAFCCIDKGKAAACFLWFKGEDHMAVLSFTTGLANKFTFHIRHGFAYGFTVGHLWLTDIGFDAKLTLHAVDNDLQMQLTHTGNNGLTGFFVRANSE
ncbi:Uncharacterised protein [Yersinia massiliensis]|nr:Uncharacterised protein [Yersinia massiliensis]